MKNLVVKLLILSEQKYAVAVSSGTAALHSAVALDLLKKVMRLSTTPMTFCATANSVLYEGGEIKFADINIKNLNIDPNEIEKKFQKTKAIIAVDFRGHPAELIKLKNCKKLQFTNYRGCISFTWIKIF